MVALSVDHGTANLLSEISTPFLRHGAPHLLSLLAARGGLLANVEGGDGGAVVLGFDLATSLPHPLRRLRPMRRALPNIGVGESVVVVIVRWSCPWS